MRIRAKYKYVSFFHNCTLIGFNKLFGDGRCNDKIKCSRNVVDSTLLYDCINVNSYHRWVCLHYAVGAG